MKNGMQLKAVIKKAAMDKGSPTINNYYRF